MSVSIAAVTHENQAATTGIVTGAYTCADGRVFIYDGFWERRGAHVHWRGHARRERRTMHTSGELLDGADPEKEVRGAIMQWIDAGCSPGLAGPFRT